MSQSRYYICIPIYDDWSSAMEILRRLETSMAGLGEIHVLFVNDASSEPPPSTLGWQPRAIASVEILNLRRNLGHQRAIAIGLSFLQQNRDFYAVVVMDADGEDRPEDVPRLIDAQRRAGENHAIFAKRGRRTDGVVFFVSYHAYRWIHRLLTGRSVEVGNFSVLLSKQLDNLVVVSELWNHYAASVFKARFSVEKVEIDRGRRIAGESRMNFTSLVIHGLSAMSVYSDTIGVRLLIATGILFVTTLTGFVLVLGIRYGTELALPIWATSAIGSLSTILLFSFMLSIVLVFVILSDRQRAGFLPLHDYKDFIEGIRSIHA